MLTLKGIVKDYVTGDTVVSALKGINIEFRKNEFVSILGPSGCGKTTLLNIIGGLDRYTSGDLFINGKSTKEFDDSDWDSYRNHSIGFVFQNYNLIPHQSVLSNVELALTLSGVSKAERKKRAKEVLEKVGLGDQVNKKPNQMSGGQMQRVAIARALVNDPDILLADEPTGALDSQTSVQIMDLLKEVAKDRLVIMVTHNPELAKQYSTRIISLLDGQVVNDTNPYKADKIEKAPELTPKERKKARKKNKTGMSFLTALSLSINNLMTKKTRTLLTSFAGSIGIIGIALILSVSSGVQNYINYVQKDTLSSYPITLKSESMDMSALMNSFMGVKKENAEAEHDKDKVYLNSIMFDLVNSFNSAETSRNDLEAFKKYIENNDEFEKYASSIQYLYDYNMNVYAKDKNGDVVKSDIMALVEAIYASAGMSTAYMSNMANMDIWEEMLPGENGALISDVLKEQYDVIAGDWPSAYDEVVLIVNENNELSDLVLYALGLITEDEMMEIYKAMSQQEQVDIQYGPWDYDSFIWSEGKEPFFKLILSTEFYQEQADGTYRNIADTQAGLAILYSDSSVGIPLKISGIIRANEDASSAMLSGNVAYTSALTDKVIEKTMSSKMIADQLADKTKDVITGLPFKPSDFEEKELTNAEKTEKIKEYFGTLPTDKKVSLYKTILSVPTAKYLQEQVATYMLAMSEDDITSILVKVIIQQYQIDEEQALQYIATLDAVRKQQMVSAIIAAKITAEYSAKMQPVLEQMTDEQIFAMFDTLDLREADYASLYDEYMPLEYSESTYEDNLEDLGYVTKDRPSAINIYADTFENKDKIAELIAEYNKSVSEEQKIEYTDYVALLMSSITTIINAISYVLIAFVAISLVVSSIMIGIITYISVLERTKEIGVLRSIGASKRDIARVFNAETLIVGFTAGVIGIGITLLLTIPINALLFALTEIANLKATLPYVGGIVLVVISMLLTLIAGLIPSRLAAKKDPVVALRTE